MDNIEILFERFNIDPNVGETKVKQLIRERYGDRMSEKQYNVLDERIHAYYYEQRVAKLKALKQRYHIVVNPKTLDKELSVHFPDMSESSRHALKISLLELEGYDVESIRTQEQDFMDRNTAQDQQQDLKANVETEITPDEEDDAITSDSSNDLDKTQVMQSFTEMQSKKRSTVSAHRIQYLKANHKRMGLFAALMLLSGVLGFVFVGKVKILQVAFGSIQALVALVSVVYIVKALRNEKELKPSMMFQWFVVASALTMIGSIPMMIPSGKVASLSLLFLGSAWLVNGLIIILSVVEKKYDDAYAVYKEIH